MKTRDTLLVIGLGALLLRAALLIFVRHPGIADPNHYYNLGRQLVAGHGFQIDYIWQYYNPPAQITHPDDFWVPLTGVLAAAGMALFGETVRGALIPFLVLGALLPLLVYGAGRQLGGSESSSLFAAALAAVLPEYVLNSLRTDTLLPNAVLLAGCFLLLDRCLRTGSRRAALASGGCAGLAYLARGDNVLLLPMLLVTAALYAAAARRLPGVGSRLSWPALALIPAAALLVAAPWLIRNVRATGSITTPHLSRTFFMTDFRDHYAYERPITWETLRASQSWRQIIGKRLFEMAASVKILYTTLDLALPVLLWGGLILLVARRDWARLLALAPPLILLGGMYVFYTVLAPYGSQGGSFKKSYLSLLPLLIPVGAAALEQAVPDRRLRLGAMLLILGFMTANAVELARSDTRFTNAYLRQMDSVAAAVRTLPDTNEDGQIVLMAQDPFMLRFVGLRSVTIPMEDRATILRVAQRYHADYLLMPAARPALDPLYEGREGDPRFVWVADVRGTKQQLFRFAAENP